MQFIKLIQLSQSLSVDVLFTVGKEGNLSNAYGDKTNSTILDFRKMWIINFTIVKVSVFLEWHTSTKVVINW